MTAVGIIIGIAGALAVFRWLAWMSAPTDDPADHSYFYGPWGGED